MANRIQYRRDTAANWTAANPVLALGEPGYETDTGKRKIGDGVTAWISLGYQASVQATLDLAYSPATPPKPLAAFHTALAQRNTNPVDIMAVGHSYFEGVHATSVNNTILQRLAANLRQRFQPSGITGGYGYYTKPFVSYFTDDPLVDTGGTQVINSGVGLGRKSWTGTAAGNKRVLTFTGTGVDIFYAKFNAGGTGYYKIDGGASTTFSTLNSSGGFGTYNTLDGQRIQVRGLTAGSHTVEVGWSSGGTVFVNGFMIYNGDESKGIRVWNGSKSSQQSSYFVDTANPAWTDNVATVQPSLIIFGTLCNDWYYGMPSATSKTNLQTLIANIKAKCTTTPSFIFNLEFQRDITSGSTVEPWANYVKVAYDIAAADPNNVAVFDMGKRAFGPGPFTAGTALVDPDKIHPNDAGMQAWADALAGFLLPR